jgi:hypothetical protein
MPQNIPDEQRFTPQINAVDPNVARVLKNAGYQNFSIPPGMQVDTGNQQFQVGPPSLQGAQNVTPGSQNQEYIEVGASVNANAFQNQAQPQMQPQMPQMQPQYPQQQPQVQQNVQQPQMQPQVQQQQVQHQPDPTRPNNANPGNPLLLVNQLAQQEQQAPQNQDPFTYVTDEKGQVSAVPNVQAPEQQQQAQQQEQANLNQAQQNLINMVNAGNQAQAQQQPQQFQQQQQPNGYANGHSNDPVQQQLAQQQQLIEILSRQQAANQQPQQQQAQDDQEAEAPKLEDFTDKLGDSWDESEALKIGTKSNAAYVKFQNAVQTHREEQLTKRIMNQINQSQTATETRAKAQQLAQMFPEFQMPDGSPDGTRIRGFFKELMNGDWIALKRAYDASRSTQITAMQPQNPNNVFAAGAGYNQPQQLQYQQPQYVPQQQQFVPSQQATQFAQQVQLNRQATTQAGQRIVPIHSGSANSGPIQPRIPNSISTLMKQYGPNFELPPGAQIAP